MVDGVFLAAKAADPKVFAADSSQEVARQAKFEVACVALAAAVTPMADLELRRAVLEEMVDRLEIGLREGGVGDMTIGPKVRTYAAAMNGRLIRYEELILAKNWAGLAKAAGGHQVAEKAVKTLVKGLAKGGRVR